MPEAAPDAPWQLLFVCTGNTCRSPLAEVIARREVARRGAPHVRVASAGTHAWPDAPASDGSLLVALEHGLDLSAHRARVLTPELVRDARVILSMGSSHREVVEAMGGAGRVALLGGFGAGGARAIADPFGGGLDVYRQAYAEIEAEVHAALDRLLPVPGSATAS
jgi:protein-tyrosine-phosphatase